MKNSPPRAHGWRRLPGVLHRGLLLLVLGGGVAATAVELPPFWYWYDPATGAVTYGSGAMDPRGALPTYRPIGGPGNVDIQYNEGYRRMLETLRNNARPAPGTPAIPPPPTGAVTGGGAVVGTVAFVAVAGFAIYKSGEYYYYTNQLVDDVGSQPANNLTEYEDPSNYWDQFWRYYGWNG